MKLWVLGLSLAMGSASAQDAMELANNPYAQMETAHVCTMLGSVVAGGKAVPYATVVLTASGVEVVRATTNRAGIYEITFPANPGQLVKETEVLLRGGGRLRNGSRPTATCVQAQVSVGGIEVLQ